MFGIVHLLRAHAEPDFRDIAVDVTVVFNGRQRTLKVSCMGSVPRLMAAGKSRTYYLVRRLGILT